MKAALRTDEDLEPLAMWKIAVARVRRPIDRDKYVRK